MDPLEDSWAFKVLDGESNRLSTICRGEDEFSFARSWDTYLLVFVDISIRMSADVDGFGPVPYPWWDVLYQDRAAEDRPVKSCSNGPIGARPFFFEVVFCDAVLVWCDGCTFHSDAMSLYRISGIMGDFVIGLITFFQPQVVVFQVHVEKWEEEFFFDHLPHDSGHFVSIDFHDGIFHLDFSSWFFCFFHVSDSSNLILYN